MIKHATISCCFLLACLSGAQAQCARYGGESPSASTICVQSQLSLSVQASAANQADQIKTMEEARNRLFEISKRECDALAQEFKANCKFGGIAINSQIGARGQDRTVQVSMSNAYELNLKP